MKWRSLKPLIFQFFSAMLVYVVAPLMLILSKGIQVYVDSNIAKGFIILGIFLYIHFTISYFLPGCLSLLDLLTNNFEIKKMKYVESYIDKSFFLVSNEPKKKIGKIVVNEYCFLKVIFLNQSIKSMYTSTYFHYMEKNQTYFVQYGKLSKVIISVQSEMGEEMLYR